MISDNETSAAPLLLAPDPAQVFAGGAMTEVATPSSTDTLSVRSVISDGAGGAVASAFSGGSAIGILADGGAVAHYGWLRQLPACDPPTAKPFLTAARDASIPSGTLPYPVIPAAEALAAPMPISRGITSRPATPDGPAAFAEGEVTAGGAGAGAVSVVPDKHERAAAQTMPFNIYHAPDAEDGLTATDAELAQMINAYRVQNGLPPIELSDSLSLVANRHVEDIIYNQGGVQASISGSNAGHSWSDDPYNANVSSTYTAIWQAPQRLGTTYPGNGYEILAGYLAPITNSQIITPQQALSSWEQDPAHNAVLLNQYPWNTPELTWNAMGIAILDGVACVWFGHQNDPAGSPNIYLQGDYDQYSVVVGGGSVEVDDIGNAGDPSFTIPDANDLVFKDGTFAIATGTFTPLATPHQFVNDDFTGNGTSDVLLVDGNGNVIDWVMQNGQFAGWNFIGNTASYSLAGTLNFADNGPSDLLLADSYGNVINWTMQDGGLSGWQNVANANGYRIAGTGDFSGNGASDVLLENGSGNVIDWMLQNGRLAGWNEVGGAQGYSIVGTGDFSGNGTFDVLLENGSGNVIDWMMQNGQLAGWNEVGGTNGYNIVGTGDFNGDGTTDILLENASGNVIDWAMQNGQYAGWNEVGSAQGYSIVGTGDYTGNGTDDVLLKNASGNVIDWIMQNGRLMGWGEVGAANGFTPVA